LIISAPETHILLNQLLLRGQVEVDVSYPPYETTLFTLNLAKFEIENLIDKKTLDSKKRKLARTEFLRHDLPGYHDLADVLISSGVLEFENSAEIEENFELLRKSVSDRTIYIKPVFIGIDTNIAYYRIISRRLKNHFKYVISNIVVDEIDSRIHTKYTPRMMHEFEHIPYSHIFREFANGSCKDARMAKNAMNEVQYIVNNLDAFRIGKVSDTKDKEVRDREIARQYSSFSSEINAEVILLTADKDMVFHAQAEQMSSIYFKLPHAIPSTIHIDSTSIPSLIYDLTLIFGMIKIGNYLLLGEWHGKSSEDYFYERIKIYNSEKDIVRHINICRSVMNEFQRDAC